MARAFSFDWPTLLVTGPDAATWLNGIVTGDVLGATRGASVWGLLLSKHGKIQANLLIVGRKGQLWIAVMGGDAGQIVTTLEKYLVMEDAELSSAQAELSWALIADATDAELTRLREHFPVAGGPGPESWLGPHPFGPARGHVLAVERRVEVLREELETLGFACREPDGVDWLGQRLAWGIPELGRDFTSADNPHEASLDRRAVDWNKGCYLGQEVVCMQDMRGKIKRRIARVQVEPGAAVDLVSGDEVTSDGAAIGAVTSALGGAGFVQLKAPHYEPGTRVLVGGAPAIVHSLGEYPAD